MSSSTHGKKGALCTRASPTPTHTHTHPHPHTLLSCAHPQHAFSQIIEFIFESNTCHEKKKMARFGVAVTKGQSYVELSNREQDDPVIRPTVLLPGQEISAEEVSNSLLVSSPTFDSAIINDFLLCSEHVPAIATTSAIVVVLRDVPGQTDDLMRLEHVPIDVPRPPGPELSCFGFGKGPHPALPSALAVHGGRMLPIESGVTSGRPLDFAMPFVVC